MEVRRFKTQNLLNVKWQSLQLEKIFKTWFFYLAFAESIEKAGVTLGKGFSDLGTILMLFSEGFARILLLERKGIK